MNATMIEKALIQLFGFADSSSVLTYALTDPSFAYALIRTEEGQTLILRTALRNRLVQVAHSL